MNNSKSDRNFGVMCNSPEGLERLKELILSLAVQGKLTSKLDFDDRVEDLLTATGKIQKPHPEISEERFEIPITWKWVPLASIAEHQLGKMLNSSKMKGGRRSYLRSLNIRQDGSINLSDLKEMLLPETELDKYSVRLGDIFVNEGGDVGRSAIFTIETEMKLAFQNALHRLRPLCGIDARYIHIVLQQAKQQGEIARMSAGVTIQHFSASALRRFAVPLPPLSEQKEIVDKVDALIDLCGQLSTQQNLRNVLGVAARKSAVDAISTSQTPEELKIAWTRIQEKWEVIAGTQESIEDLRSLILELEMKRYLIESHESDPIVEKWTSAPLREVCDYIQRGKSPKYASTGACRVASQKCVRWSGFDSEQSRYIDDSSLIGYSIERFLRVGDLLWNSTGTGTVGRTALFKSEESEQKYVADSHVTVLRSTILHPEYLYYWSRSPDIQDEVSNSTTGSTNQQELNLGKLKEMVITFPSLPEQERTVHRIRALFVLCDQLEVETLLMNDLSRKFIGSVLSSETYI